MHEDWKMKARCMKRGLKVRVIAVVAVAVFGFILMSLWNWLATAVFGLRTITFWQALGILILSKILSEDFAAGRANGASRRRPMPEHFR
jgi:hypothetical protein